MCDSAHLPVTIQTRPEISITWQFRARHWNARPRSRRRANGNFTKLCWGPWCWIEHSRKSPVFFG